MMEWKMEWNNERKKLQLTRVTGTVQSRSNYLVVSLGLLCHRRSFMSKFGTARRHASISTHCTVASSSSGALLL